MCVRQGHLSHYGRLIVPIFSTYPVACEELNLLESETHWDTAIVEAIISTSPSQMRTLFATFISTCLHRFKEHNIFFKTLDTYS